ncbi:hypothetical protein B9M44_003238 [Salmonella enterica subsp. enterica serovar Beaudesert]|nr:hypothetical protein [Salmonella enterica]EDR4439688.1 hypothetical protein [Salmonella enterica subsp. enterica serovar Beaudesert]EEE1088830.1 hypothetical protein [Salmonella enterica subsp. enterica serovar Beaudesert]EEE2137438.1 hypothetical protein [Salmonella enterica subsp. enterica serovar Beaudesert]
MLNGLEHKRDTQRFASPCKASCAFWCEVCSCDKKLAQEDKNHLALMLCLRSLM